MRPLPDLFANLRLPVIGAPMFIVSYPALVMAQCKAGIVGCFPSLNARPLETLDAWLAELTTELAAFRAANPGAAIGPFGVNLIVHPSNSRLRADAELVVRHRVPLVITSVGPPGRIVEAVHGYGGLVFHDVTNVRHAKKAISEGVDGLILVAAGAGGHAGTASPFALTAEVREFYDGPLVLAGAISHGHQVRAAQIMGADLAYLGTRFIATEEANAAPGYKQMIVDDDLKDLIYSPAFTGIPANYLRRSVEAAGIDPNAVSGEKPDVGLDLAGKDEAKAWKDIWSAGQGIGTIKDVPSVAGLVERLAGEYGAAS